MIRGGTRGPNDLRRCDYPTGRRGFGTQYGGYSRSRGTVAPTGCTRIWSCKGHAQVPCKRRAAHLPEKFFRTAGVVIPPYRHDQAISATEQLRMRRCARVSLYFFANVITPLIAGSRAGSSEDQITATVPNMFISLIHTTWRKGEARCVRRQPHHHQSQLFPHPSVLNPVFEKP